MLTWTLTDPSVWSSLSDLTKTRFLLVCCHLEFLYVHLTVFNFSCLPWHHCRRSARFPALWWSLFCSVLGMLEFLDSPCMPQNRWGEQVWAVCPTAACRSIPAMLSEHCFGSHVYLEDLTLSWRFSAKPDSYCLCSRNCLTPTGASL